MLGAGGRSRKAEWGGGWGNDMLTVLHKFVLEN